MEGNKMPTDHEINVVLQNGNAVPSLPARMNLGQTVHYSSNDGPVTILFVDNGSPFTDANGDEITVITSAAPPLFLSKPSATGFTCRCFITLPTGMTVGWGPNFPKGGGNQIVK
jgi:hypothetical protein